ncbi:MAG: hypothetical protein V8S77_08045 [Oscillospiraceae bacterium]
MPGTLSIIFHRPTHLALQQNLHLLQDRDLQRENMGVTFVFMCCF